MRKRRGEKESDEKKREEKKRGERLSNGGVTVRA